MATPPFTGDTSDPGDASIVSQFPANERTHRDEIQSWLTTEHDTNGRHVVGAGSTTARNAITTFGVNNFWINTDTSPAVLQRCTVAGSPATFENLGTLTVSISLTAPSWLAVTGSPAGNGGTLALSGGNVTANNFLGGPTSGAAAAVAPRALVDADLPATAVRTSRNVNTGQGLTGGGNLGADLTIALSSISGVQGTWGGTTQSSTAYIEGLTITGSGRISQIVTNNLPSAPAGGGGSGGVGGTCFPGFALVEMADGSLKRIDEVRLGEMVADAYGAPVAVIGLDRTTLDTRLMFEINGEHWTSDEHPHMRPERVFVSPNPNAIYAEWGRSFEIIVAKGRTTRKVQKVNIGLPDGLVTQMRKGQTLLTAHGPRLIHSLEVGDCERWTPDTPLYNLVLSGSGTYRVDGYVVTGWPDQNRFDYEKWEMRAE